MTGKSDYSELPGGEYLAEGLRDLAGGGETLPALLLLIAAERLAAAGVHFPPSPFRGGKLEDPETRLYRLLVAEHGDDAHGQYNAHLRRLSSLCRALEMRNSNKAPV